VTELLIAIAMLCLPGTAHYTADKQQLSCQQYYIACLETQGQWSNPKKSYRVKLINSSMLAECIKVRKIK